MESYRAWLIHWLAGLSCAVDTSQVQFGLMNTFPVILKSDQRKLVHVRTGKQENKARRKEGKEEWKKRTSADVILAALTRRDHTGSRAIWCLTEIDRRTHTCMIDASIYGISHARQRKSAGSVTSMFWNTHERPAHRNSLIVWLETGLFLRNEQVRRVDQIRYPMIVVASLTAVALWYRVWHTHTWSSVPTPFPPPHGHDHLPHPYRGGFGLVVVLVVLVTSNNSSSSYPLPY